jgi:hypothetical protein
MHMAVRAPKVRISTPTEPILPGRGFYQLEEDALYVQIGPFLGNRRFFSYLESEKVNLHFDREGRLIFIEVDEARRRWPVSEEAKPPRVVEPADIRWLDFRSGMDQPQLLTNKRRTILKLEFGTCPQPKNFYLAEDVIAQFNDDNELCAIWISDIVDDLAGQEIAAFRKKLRKTATIGRQ